MDIALNDVLPWVRLASTSIVAVLLLAVSAAPLVAGVSQHLAHARERIFYDKFAKQVAQMGLAFALCTLPFTAGIWAVLYMQHPLAKIQGFAHPMLSTPALLPFCIYALALLLCTIHAANWGFWKGKRFVQSLFAWVAWICMLLAGASLLLLKRVLNASQDAFAVTPTFASFFDAVQAIPLLSSLWPFMALVLCGGVAAAGAFGALYCLARRTKEDYGRDYYAFALKAACWWGAIGAALASLAAGGYVYLVAPRFTALFTAIPIQAGLAAAAMLLIAALGLASVAGSATPLRRKLTVFLAALLLLLASGGMGYLTQTLYTLF
ncbi:hypothetical protein [Megalodesulfovibrio paquesii]